MPGMRSERFINNYAPLHIHTTPHPLFFVIPAHAGIQ